VVNSDFADGVAVLLVAVVTVCAFTCGSGCTPALTKPIEFAEQTQPSPPSISEVVGAPAGVAIAGLPAPVSGLIFSEEQVQAMRAHDASDHAHIEDAHEYARDVMWQCRIKDEAMIGALQQARRAQWEALGVGLLGGMGACGAVGGAVVLGRQ
jgi:hypothetical protein